MTEVETIKGKFVERRYDLKNKHNLNFREHFQKDMILHKISIENTQ